MRDNRKNVVLSVINMINVVLVTIPFVYCWYRFFAPAMIHPYYRRGNWAVILVFVVLYVLFGRVYDGFSISTKRITESVYSQCMAILFTDAVMYIVIFLLAQYLPAPVPMLLNFMAQVILTGVGTILSHKWYFSTFQPNRSIVVYDTRQGMEDMIEKYRMQKEFRVCKIVSISECLEDLDMLQEMDTVFMSGVHSHERNIVLKYCVERGIEMYVIPRVGDLIMSGAKRMHLFYLPILKVGRYDPSLYYVFFKRVMDIVLSILALIILSPLFLISAIAVKVYDGGPVFYRQRRLTKDGREFDIIKFRSMRVDAESDGVARLSTGDKDDRITPVGRILRKLRLDELPQLFCILAGDMSICGPRPERPELAAQIEKTLPEFRLRLQTKAGLTGYAQVYGKYNTSPYDKLQMDLMYIANPSFLEDMRIIFATVKILFQPESTEGVLTEEAEASGKQETVGLEN
ncbi:MAG: exopolysaccharide biosynthesis polyprenyl glycosylphosphotransferase [Oscillospiraceae bacterium]|nr:exopolysaccharide biosynthesis polyprenyl glycosylphosphotransferase [Oscillospiraceae bacterium]